MDLVKKSLDMDVILDKSSIIEDAVAVIHGDYFGVSEAFYSGRCNCHSSSQSGSHSNSRSTASAYTPKNQKVIGKPDAFTRSFK